MVTVTQDPNDPTRLVLTAAVSVYLDKVLLDTLAPELEQAIREQAIKDLRSNAQVKKLIAKAATDLLLRLLGAQEPSCTL